MLESRGFLTTPGGGRAYHEPAARITGPLQHAEFYLKWRRAFLRGLVWGFGGGGLRPKARVRSPGPQPGQTGSVSPETLTAASVAALRTENVSFFSCIRLNQPRLFYKSVLRIV
jgi:hypothetical protein